MMNERADVIRSRIRERAGLRNGHAVGLLGLHSKDAQVQDGRTLVVTANTADVDLQGEVVIPEGADTTYFEANRKIFMDHRYTFDSAVGGLRGLELADTPGGKVWKARIGLAETDAGDAVLALAKECGVGVSIGFEPIDYGPPTDEEVDRYGQEKVPNLIHRRWKWLELSVTAMPCNVACQSDAVRLDESKAAGVRELVTKGAISERMGRMFLPAAPKRRVLPVVLPLIHEV